MGGAGASFAAVASRENIIMIFKPLLFVFGAWILLDVIEDPVAASLGSGFDDTLMRQKNPLYWFDADYLPAFFTFPGVGVYDVWELKGSRNRLYLSVFTTGGTLAGLLPHFLFG